MKAFNLCFGIVGATVPSTGSIVIILNIEILYDLIRGSQYTFEAWTTEVY